MTGENSTKKLKKSKVFIIGVFLIIAGVSLAISPFLQDKYYAYQHAKLVEERFNQPVILPEENETEKEKYPKKLEAADGLLEIPSLDLKANVGYGVGEDDLKKGPGFYPQSGYPDTGNVSIAGHRNAYGSHFWHLDKLEKGHEIILYYNNKVYTYEVDRVFITHSKDWSVIEQTPEAALTLTTCDPVVRPPGGEYDRLIARAYLKNTEEME